MKNESRTPRNSSRFHWAAVLAAMMLADQGAVGQTNTAAAGTNAPAISTSILRRDLSLADCLNLALQQNPAVIKSQRDLEAAHGVVVQTRAIAYPKAQVSGQYQAIDEGSIDTPSALPVQFGTDQSWGTELRVVQSIYEGGRINSALRTARLTTQQALLSHETIVADTLLATRLAYYAVLLAERQIEVQEASVKLLEKELDDATRRFNAGTVPRFNVLRAEVEVANARPKVSRARNAHRIAKNVLVNRLGCNLPSDVWEDIPLQLTGRLEAQQYSVALPAAIALAATNRSEIQALRVAQKLRREALVSAKSGYKPSVQLFAGYGSRSSSFENDLSFERHGWLAGAQVNWAVFDGLLTKGKVKEAQALYEKAQTEVDDVGRQIELEVRTAYSTFVEAREVLDSQSKVLEQADEALRLAKAREEAGTGTQLDVLNAQTALTQARTIQIQALHDYAVARARLERATGK